MKKYLSLTFLLSALLPAVALAQVTDVFSAESFIIGILGKLGYLFWVMSIVYFFYGLVKFINNANEPDEREKGKQIMIWGIISFLVLVSLWAIVKFILVDTLGITASPLDYRDKNGSIVAP